MGSTSNFIYFFSFNLWILLGRIIALIFGVRSMHLFSSIKPKCDNRLSSIYTFCTSKCFCTNLKTIWCSKCIKWYLLKRIRFNKNAEIFWNYLVRAVGTGGGGRGDNNSYLCMCHKQSTKSKSALYNRIHSQFG